MHDVVRCTMAVIPSWRVRWLCGSHRTLVNNKRLPDNGRFIGHSVFFFSFFPDSSGTPGEEEEGESKENQQKVSFYPQFEHVGRDTAKHAFCQSDVVVCCSWTHVLSVHGAGVQM